eukprot:CAMPEP_0174367978 /NCGR_PEP_ID=MMETSP0811_2-20130205/87328_1 /TAXON_ID=73025 ORGANISM="Eutreptiella gymnastica-like, Strain CCMP1594" /NCGR_SAMPLE_ID=MMETSP0811_2 /ASSEMBLY_ACC=CAM_ASM_000667 /LENGTH=44 /DNA_ID= /DNA_START= /DNA_END= /DNA_ORIENTATION=
MPWGNPGHVGEARRAASGLATPSWCKPVLTQGRRGMPRRPRRGG